MCFTKIKKLINYSLCCPSKRKKGTDQHLKCFEMKKIKSANVNDDDYSIAFANLYEGGIDFSDSINNLFKI